MNFRDGQHKLKGVVTNNRENLYFVNFSKTVAHFRWLSDEDLEKLIADRDPVDAPSCPYKIQPENQVNLTKKVGNPAKKKANGIMLPANDMTLPTAQK